MVVQIEFRSCFAAKNVLHECVFPENKTFESGQRKTPLCFLISIKINSLNSFKLFD